MNIGAFEAKTHLSALISQVEDGEEIIITRHGTPVARLCPIHEISNRPVNDIISHFKAMSAQYSLQGLSIRELRDEGRM